MTLNPEALVATLCIHVLPARRLVTELFLYSLHTHTHTHLHHNTIQLSVDKAMPFEQLTNSCIHGWQLHGNTEYTCTDRLVQ